MQPHKRGYKELFTAHFGKQITEYDAFKRAVEGKKPGTISNYFKYITRFCLFLDENPDIIIEKRKKDITCNDPVQVEHYERKVKSFISSLVEQDIVVSAPLGVIHGFFTNNGRRLALDLGQLKYPKARKKRKYSPSVEDVRLLNSHVDNVRDHFIVAVAFQNGALPVDVSSLNIGDYPVEAWQYFERSRSKTGETWRGVSTPDVCEYLQTYMVIRKGKTGEPLLLGREGNRLGSEDISQVIRVAIKKAGLDKINGFIPKCLRDGFEDALVDCDINRKVKEALMGHCVNIEHEYGGFNRMVERLVEAVKKVYPSICLNETNLQTSLSVFNTEQTEKLKTLLDNYPVFMRMAEMLEKGELVRKSKDAE